MRRPCPDCWRKTFAVLETHVEDYEVIVVNDGSYDDTAAVLEQLRGQYGPCLRVVTHPQNRGYGGALRSGFEAAHQGIRLLHRWRRPVRRRANCRACWSWWARIPAW